MSLFAFLTGRQARRRKYQPYRFRPRLEVLEGRALPSTLVVTNTSDTGVSGDGSLRGEILAATSGDTIVFADSVQGIILTNASGELALSKSLDILGRADNPVVISGYTSRVFDITSSSATVTLFGLTITGGSDQCGGGVFNVGTLTVSHSNISNNSAGDGAGIFNKSGGTVTISDSTLSGNFILDGDGGGILNEGTLATTAVIPGPARCGEKLPS
jgi:hypothetical protein